MKSKKTSLPFFDDKIYIQNKIYLEQLFSKARTILI